MVSDLSESIAGPLRNRQTTRFIRVRSRSFSVWESISHCKTAVGETLLSKAAMLNDIGCEARTEGRNLDGSTPKRVLPCRTTARGRPPSRPKRRVTHLAVQGLGNRN